MSQQMKKESLSTNGHEAVSSKSHIAYCDYYATGEGVTVMVAVGCSASHAERMFKEHAHPYFHPGMVVDRLDSADPDVRRMVKMVPAPVLLVFEGTDGAPQFYSELHFNLA